ncbi:hypothetical protein QN372_00195 [Undibacterium sp. RTI2.1]|uniref:hypothetical protein n=1 Tax=unclassified Undibacterium TaxID=2630295 RepID=UPI002AB59D77|nr:MULTISPECIES: hypothetical protein [unclassified Undibacterium]MDY7537561.1 hypothetical protein [Undibacterium sp. 5I1]MEB0029158.1 hypothetical protein [Undibacterium sp. RTI2.1]MEB0115466.1 hypothetical protein [Undibacterium sp. RTI2.2]MEB0231946.1 hypothetical protein [Undibacterium sp. 10I3]MEB0256297.1 hypothetical protein [Undibacterium sp. 5I1]
MKSYTCPQCANYLMGSDGECHDCHCGWKQPDEVINHDARVEELERRVEELEKPTNLNAPCQARLTAYGAQVWNAQYAKTPIEFKPEPVKANDLIKTQLWLLMQVYGAGLYLSMHKSKLPFVNNEITIGKSV